MRLKITFKNPESGSSLVGVIIAAAIVSMTIAAVSGLVLKRLSQMKHNALRNAYSEVEKSWVVFSRQQIEQFAFNDLDDCSDVGDLGYSNTAPEYLTTAETNYNFTFSKIGTVPALDKADDISMSRMSQLASTCSSSTDQRIFFDPPGVRVDFDDDTMHFCSSITPTDQTQSTVLSSTRPVYVSSRYTFTNIISNEKLSCQDFLADRDNGESVGVIHNYTMYFTDKKNQKMQLHKGSDIVEKVGTGSVSGGGGGGGTVSTNMVAVYIEDRFRSAAERMAENDPMDVGACVSGPPGSFLFDPATNRIEGNSASEVTLDIMIVRNPGATKFGTAYLERWRGGALVTYNQIFSFTPFSTPTTTTTTINLRAGDELRIAFLTGGIGKRYHYEPGTSTWPKPFIEHGSCRTSGMPQAQIDFPWY